MILEISSYMQIISTTFKTFSLSLQCNVLQCTAMKCNVMQVATLNQNNQSPSLPSGSDLFCGIFGSAGRVQNMTSRLIADISTKGCQHYKPHSVYFLFGSQSQAKFGGGFFIHSLGSQS